MRSRVIHFYLIILTGCALIMSGSAYSIVSKPNVTPPTKPTPVPIPTAKPTPPPPPTTPFEPNVVLKTIRDTSGKNNEIKFVNGIIINSPDGGAYEICGTVSNAPSLQMDAQKRTSVNIDGRPVFMKSVSKDLYHFCGNINLKRQSAIDENDHASMFNNFVIMLVSQTGGVYKNRYTIINSENRPIEDNTHYEAVNIVLNDTDTTNNISNYLSHFVNDFVLSNQSHWADMFKEKYMNMNDHSCDMSVLVENANDKQEGLLKQILMYVGESAYQFFKDIDNDESMTLCPSSLTISSSSLRLVPGQTPEEMFKLSGYISNLKLKFDFKHMAATDLPGQSYDRYVAEDGVLVINLGKVELSGIISDLNIDEGITTGHVTVGNIKVSDIHSWWEDFVIYDHFGEINSSGMDQIDEKMNEKMKNGIASDKIMDTDINKQSDKTNSIAFQPAYIYLSWLAMIFNEQTVDVPEGLTDAFSEQTGYISTENYGFYNIYNDYEIGFAIDDDMVNQNLLFKTKQGAFSRTGEKLTDSGKQITYDFNASVAPVLIPQGEDEYAMRFEFNNMDIAISELSSGLKGEYRMDLMLKMAFGEGTVDAPIALTVIESAINTVAIQTIPIPDKLLNKVFDKMISQIVEKMSVALNEQVKNKINKAMNASGMDLCTDIAIKSMNGSNNYLTGSVDLVYGSISSTDKCYVNTWPVQPLIYSEPGTTACDPDKADCQDDGEINPYIPDTSDIIDE